MRQFDGRSFHRSIAQKAEAVLDAIRNGHCRIASIAEATGLPETTVIRVARLLREQGKISVTRNETIELRTEA
ncbi:helix-turn-helix domain-containing protein [Sphingopyxis chilensis]